MERRRGGGLQPRREPQSLYDSCLRAQLLKERLFAPITHVVPSYYSEVWASSELYAAVTARLTLQTCKSPPTPESRYHTELCIKCAEGGGEKKKKK